MTFIGKINAQTKFEFFAYEWEGQRHGHNESSSPNLGYIIQINHFLKNSQQRTESITFKATFLLAIFSHIHRASCRAKRI